MTVESNRSPVSGDLGVDEAISGERQLAILRSRRVPAALMYFLSFGAVPFFGFVQTKVLTTVLPQEAVGDIQLVLPILGVCLLVGGLGIPNYILRFHSRDGRSAFQEGAGLALLATILLSMGVALGLDRFAFASYRKWGIVAFAAVFVMEVLSEQVFALSKSLLRVSERHMRYNAFVVVERVGSVMGVILGVLLFRSAPVEGYLLGSGLGTFCVIVPLWLSARSSYFLRPTRPSAARVREVALYGLPVVSIVVTASIFLSSSRYVIMSADLGAAAVARYVVCFTIASLGMQVIYEPLLTYIHPRIFRVWEAGQLSDAQRLWRRYLLLYVVAGGLLAFIFVLGQDLLIRLIANPTYQLPRTAFGWLLVAAFAMGIYRFAATHYLIRKKTMELAVIFLSALAINIAAALLLVRPYGMTGVAASAALSAALLAIVVWWRGRHTLPLGGGLRV